MLMLNNMIGGTTSAPSFRQVLLLLACCILHQCLAAEKYVASNFDLMHGIRGRNLSSNGQADVDSSIHTLRNITDLLDTLLLGYDQHLRPDLGGAPTEVLIDFHVRSMGPIEEIDMSYSMDCYFRQAWKDSRLAYDPQSFQGKPKNLALSVNMLDKIWKPDTYFYNGKKAYIHTITNPNKLLRIASDGMVLYSSRMTVKASCPMRLERFPMDIQRCPLEVGSFGYSSRDVLYKWNPKRTVFIASDMRMSQFDLTSFHTGNVTGPVRTGGPYSRLVVSFHFKRLMGSFVIEVYAPGSLLVIMSWVSFWINREASEDRVNLGIMTFLTMTFLGLETRNDLPKVSYMTALDYFVAINFVFLFASFIEFAIVHWYTKIGTGDYFIPPLDIMKKIALAHAENFNWFGKHRQGFDRSHKFGDAPVMGRVQREYSRESEQQQQQQQQQEQEQEDDGGILSEAVSLNAPHDPTTTTVDEAGNNRSSALDPNLWITLPHHHHRHHLLHAHEGHEASVAAASTTATGIPDQEDQEMSQSLLLRQLNQEITDVQNILSVAAATSATIPLVSHSCHRNPPLTPSSTAAASSHKVIHCKSTTPSTNPVPAAASSTPLLTCQADALLQLASSSCCSYPLPPHPDEVHSNTTSVAAAAASASRAEQQEDSRTRIPSYLPSAYATLYGQLDTSIYPHNRNKHQQQHQYLKQQMKIKNDLGEDCAPNRYHHRQHQHQVTKKNKKGNRSSTREWERMPSASIEPLAPAAASSLYPVSNLLIQDGFREQDFCPVHGKITNRSSIGKSGDMAKTTGKYQKQKKQESSGSEGRMRQRKHESNKHTTTAGAILSPESTSASKKQYSSSSKHHHHDHQQHMSKGSIMVISDNRLPDYEHQDFDMMIPVTRFGNHHPLPLNHATLNNNYKNKEHEQECEDEIFTRFTGSNGVMQKDVSEDDFTIKKVKNKKDKHQVNPMSRKGKSPVRPFDSIPIRLNSVSQIDIVARIVFPICFIIINYFYWITYLGGDE